VTRARTDYQVPYSWLESALSKGLSPTAALNTFRAAGYTTTTQTWYRLAGVARRALAGQEDIRAAPRSRRPVASELLPRRSGQTRRYLYNAQVTTVDRITGEPGLLFRSVGTDRLLRFGEAVDAVISAGDVGLYPEEEDQAIVAVDITEVWGAEVGEEL